MSSNRNVPKRGRMPRVERLEERELLAMGTYRMRPASLTPASFGTLAAAAAQANAANDPSGATPTPQWQRKERFAAKFIGSYVIGPPRFTDQAATIALNGSGGSNQSLHSTLQMVFFTPAAGAGGPITGVAAVFPKNVATTGSVLALDLVATPGAAQHGLPNHFTWTVNSNSGGIYTSAGDFGKGQGTLTVQFMPATRHNNGGRVIVSIQGMINGGGIFSDIQTPGNRPKQ